MQDNGIVLDLKEPQYVNERLSLHREVANRQTCHVDLLDTYTLSMDSISTGKARKNLKRSRALPSTYLLVPSDLHQLLTTGLLLLKLYVGHDREV